MIFTRTWIAVSLATILLSPDVAADGNWILRRLCIESDVIVLGVVGAGIRDESTDSLVNGVVPLLVEEVLKGAVDQQDVFVRNVTYRLKDGTVSQRVSHHAHLVEGTRVIAFLIETDEPATYVVASWYSGVIGDDDQPVDAFIEPTREMLSILSIRQPKKRAHATASFLVTLAENPATRGHALGDFNDNRRDNPLYAWTAWSNDHLALLSDEEHARLASLFCSFEEIDHDTYMLALVLTPSEDPRIVDCMLSQLRAARNAPSFSLTAHFSSIARRLDDAPLLELAEDSDALSNLRGREYQERRLEILDSFLQRAETVLAQR